MFVGVVRTEETPAQIDEIIEIFNNSVIPVTKTLASHRGHINLLTGKWVKVWLSRIGNQKDK